MVREEITGFSIFLFMILVLYLIIHYNSNYYIEQHVWNDHYGFNINIKKLIKEIKQYIKETYFKTTNSKNKKRSKSMYIW